MPINISSMLYSLPEQNGQSYFLAMEEPSRYHLVPSSVLFYEQMWLNINSCSVNQVPEGPNDEYGILFLFQDLTSGYWIDYMDFQGPFMRLLNNDHATRPVSADHIEQSVLPIASALLVRGSSHDIAFSVQQNVVQRITTEINRHLQGHNQFHVIGSPWITWDIFPKNIDALSPNGQYIKITQKIHFDPHGVIPDVLVRNTDIYLSIWVQFFPDEEGGLGIDAPLRMVHTTGGELKSTLQQVFDMILSCVVDQLLAEAREEFKTLLQGRVIKDVYLLPGDQVADIGQQWGVIDPSTRPSYDSTFNDITVVIDYETS